MMSKILQDLLSSKLIALIPIEPTHKCAIFEVRHEVYLDLCKFLFDHLWIKILLIVQLISKHYERASGTRLLGISGAPVGTRSLHPAIVFLHTRTLGHMRMRSLFFNSSVNRYYDISSKSLPRWLCMNINKSWTEAQTILRTTKWM